MDFLPFRDFLAFLSFRTKSFRGGFRMGPEAHAPKYWTSPKFLRLLKQIRRSHCISVLTTRNDDCNRNENSLVGRLGSGIQCQFLRSPRLGLGLVSDLVRVLRLVEEWVGRRAKLSFQQFCQYATR